MQPVVGGMPDTPTAGVVTRLHLPGTSRSISTKNGVEASDRVARPGRGAALRRADGEKPTESRRIRQIAQRRRQQSEFLLSQRRLAPGQTDLA